MGRDDSGEVNMQDVRALPGISRRVTSRGLGWVEDLQVCESETVSMVCLTGFCFAEMVWRRTYHKEGSAGFRVLGRLK